MRWRARESAASTRPHALFRQRLDANVLPFVVIAMSAASWLVIVSGSLGPHMPIASSTQSSAELILSRAARNICGRPPPLGAPWLLHMQWLIGWAIMIFAMMLPTALPFLHTVREAVDRAHAKIVLLAAIVFLGMWVLAGFLLIVGTQILAVVPLPDSLNQPHKIAGLAAIIAGLYQFTPLKKACLDGCRSPRAILLCYWNGNRKIASAVASAVRYAAICIGCCWATMLLTVIVGAHALPLMVIVSAIMLAERTLPQVRRLVTVQAVLAIILGVLLYLRRIPVEVSLAAS